MSENHWQEYKEQVLESIQDFSFVYKDLANQKMGEDEWVTACCPFHEDKRPSFSFNRQTGQWVCFADCGKGSVFDFLMRYKNITFKETLLELGEQVHLPKPELKESRPFINTELLKQYNACLNEEVRRYLHDKRGLSDETINKYQIGWDVKRQRNSIPILDEKGNLVNIRLYNDKKQPKIINYTEGKWKYGSPARLYGVDELIKYNGSQVIICEGELDRLLLQQEGFMAVTGTHGCSVFRPEWADYFKEKDVVIIYDCDKAGQTAAHNIVIKALKNTSVNSIKNVVLPLSGSKDDKDITDYFHKQGFTKADLQKLIEETEIYKETIEQEPVIALESFRDIEHKQYVDKKVQCEITVCGETGETFHAVESFQVLFCPRMKKGECMDCKDLIKVPRRSQEYIGSCMSTNVQLIASLRAFCCTYGMKPTIEINERITIKEFFCHQKVNRISQTRDENDNITQNIDGKHQELVEKRVYYLSSQEVQPGSYLATGYVKTHPKTQQVTFLIESMIPQEEDYQAFDLEKNIDNLNAFKALSWSDILEDLTNNVTKVYERDEILTAILLTYCSPLWITFNKEVIRGWLVSVIMGDSGSGKTQAHNRLSEFVNIGDVFSGLTGTRTGLAYALVDHPQKGWQVRIGRYPANSRKILTVDETQLLPDWDLRVISKAMEEGFLQIDRVKSKGYESMTRLIMICNPKKDKVMDSLTFGCESLKGLFPPTIIRRTDLAVFANSGDIQDLSFINKKQTDNNSKKITAEMLRAVIYWIWNLKAQQIQFSKEAEDLCLTEANSMSEVFGYAVDIPLVLASDFRNTLARIATSFAAILLSTDDKFTRIFVEVVHVEMAIEFLTRIYSHENCALDEYSEIQKLNSQLTDYEQLEEKFIKRQENEKFNYQRCSAFTRCIYIIRTTASIKRDDIADQVGCSIEAIKKIIKFLKQYNLIDSDKTGYTKKPKFNKFLRRFLKDHPDFFEEKIVWGTPN